MENIIGKTIKFNNLEIAQFDFPDEMEWQDAKDACLRLGEGWRIPTKDELNIIYNHRLEIGNFDDYYYWCSWNSKPGFQLFKTGKQINTIQGITCLVRAVRTI